MKTKILFSVACTIIVALVSCTDDVLETVQSSNGYPRSAYSNDWTYAYVLCEGTWRVTPPSLPGYLITYDNDWDEVSAFPVGDTGNDLIRYGSKLYCAVSGHDLISDDGGIWVFDASNGTPLTTSMLQYNDPKSGHKIMPRNLAASGDKIYISLYSGAVMSIDTLTYAVQDTISLAATFSEGICVANNQVYVCNSGNLGDTYAGDGNTISVLPLNLSAETQITVALNPKLIDQASNGTIYFNALGDYFMENSALYTLTGSSYSQVTEHVGSFAIGDSAVYTVGVDWTSMDYDTYLQKAALTGGVTDFNVDDVPEFMLGYTVSINPYNGNVCFGQMGEDLYIYESNGTGPVETIQNGVANVNSVIFVK
ncbi:hypothetical protein [Proteiniphilum sp. UBA5384]|uniref:hypothetical protein n=1 Tax=Proteiniphilum sp. UBA5384 TaxID=1947279 RepID=UPI0025DC9206|nr:hypothetical protein [Proteiniphilum sp. UBA5384]